MQVSKTSFVWIFLLSAFAAAGFFYNRILFVKPSVPLPFAEKQALDHAHVIPLPFAEPLGAYGWREHSFHEKTRFKIESAGKNGFLVHAVSAKGSSALYRGVDLPSYGHPHLKWEWKVTRFPSNKQNRVLASKQDNDFGARVYAVFGPRTPLTSEVIQYVWDDHFPEGSRTESPYSKRVKVLVIRNGPFKSGDGWVVEDRDLQKDYEMLFGKKLKHSLTAVGITSDSDDTGTSSEAYFRHFELAIA